MTNKIAFAFFAAALATSTVALAQTPPAPPTAADMQSAVLKARIDAENTDTSRYETALQADRALLAKDTAALAELCRVAPRPAGCAKK
jgi:hypothetical protein